MKPRQQAAMQVGFRVAIGKLKKLHQIAVSEHAGGFRVDLCHQR